jgi:ubiquinone/menaquinone biosynthesis C-methylase UbiE
MAKLSDPTHGLTGGDLEQLDLRGESLGDYREFWDRSATVDAVRAISDQDDSSSFEISGKTDAKAMVALLPPGGGAALEIGCGIGRVLQHLAASCTELHGIDISAEMIEQARQRLEHLPNVHLHVGNGYDLEPIADDSLDLVFSQFVFQHTPKTTVYNYIVEARRVLRTGGVLRFQVPNILLDNHFAAFHHFTQPWFVEHPFPMYFYTPSEVISLLVRAGFWVEDLYEEVVAVGRNTGVGGVDPAVRERVASWDPWLPRMTSEVERVRRLAARAVRAVRPARRAGR